MKSPVDILDSIPDSLLKFLQDKMTSGETYITDDPVVDEKIISVQQQFSELIEEIRMQLRLESSLQLKTLSGKFLRDEYIVLEEIVLANLLVEGNVSRNFQLLSAMEKLIGGPAFSTMHAAALGAKNIEDNLELSIQDTKDAIRDSVEKNQRFLQDNRPQLARLDALSNVISLLKIDFDKPKAKMAKTRNSIVTEAINKFDLDIQKQVDYLQTKLIKKSLSEAQERNYSKKLVQLGLVQAAIKNYRKLPDDATSIAALLETTRRAEVAIGKIPHEGTISKPVSSLFSKASTTQKIINIFLSDLEKLQQSPRLKK
jgi:hypothetical protein